MEVKIQTEPEATKEHFIAAIQWLENLVANTPSFDPAFDDGVVMIISIHAAATEDARNDAFTVVDESGLSAFSEQYWIDNGEVPPLLFGSEDPEHGVIELDFTNRNLPNY